MSQRQAKKWICRWAADIILADISEGYMESALEDEGTVSTWLSPNVKKNV